MLKQIFVYSPSCLFFFLFINSQSLSAQTVSGRVVNPYSQPRKQASVALLSMDDTTAIVKVNCDSTGKFIIRHNRSGKYRLKVMDPQFEPLIVSVTLDSLKPTRELLQLTTAVQVFKGTGITVKRDPVTQKNDTLEYSASNFKVNQDATAENLVNKMPGITNENGTIKAQGEEIKKVTVDGQEFFGEDAAAALKNLPAELVDRIQVFDRASDQSQFSGIDDGNSQKTLNIVTKNGKNNGQFGKIYAGYGTDDRWAAGGNINAFLGKHRLSFIGMSNNINQQNFSSQDILGTLGQSAQQGGMRGGMAGGPGGRGGPNRGGGDMSNFMVNQQNGINVTNSFGVNYNGFAWKKTKLTASYFYNNGTNNTSSFLKRTYFLSSLSNQFYNQGDTGETKNFSHRLNVRFEHNIDTNNSIVYTPTLRLQGNKGLSLFRALTSTYSGDTLNQSRSETDANSGGWTFNHSLLLRHKFKRAGQTVSLNLTQNLGASDGETVLNSDNSYFEPTLTNDVFSQKTETITRTNELTPNLSYTHPFGKKSIVELSYNPSFTRNYSEKMTNRKDTAGNFNLTDSLLSNVFYNNSETQRAGLTYRFKASKLSFNLGANVQRVILKGDRTFPLERSFSRPFDNVLPNAMLTWAPSKSKNLRLYYRSRTNLPSVTQLQNVINNSNPLILSAGNENLSQEFNNMVFFRYSASNAKKGQTFFWFGNYSNTLNYIGNANFLAQSDTVINGVSLNKGAQLNMPVNLSGYRSFRTFVSYALPVKKLKSAFSFNAGQSITRSPALINGKTNFSTTSNTNAGLVVASNVSENLDFTINYSANYNVIENSLQSTSNSSYLIHNFNAKLNWLFAKKFVFNTDITNSTYSGLGSGFNQSIWLVNGGMGYKFLKDNRGELKVSVFDALRKNNSISRTVTENYIEDKTTKILTRFYMLTFTYSIRNFRPAAAATAKPEARQQQSK